MPCMKRTLVRAYLFNRYSRSATVPRGFIIKHKHSRCEVISGVTLPLIEQMWLAVKP